MSDLVSITPNVDDTFPLSLIDTRRTNQSIKSKWSCDSFAWKIPGVELPERGQLARAMLESDDASGVARRVLTFKFNLCLPHERE